VAACGLDYYGSDLIPGWKNSLLMTSLKNATLFRHQLNAEGTAIQSTEQLFRTRWGRLRDVCVSPAGRIYLCTSNGNDQDILLEISSPE
jgi:glucose/arabinose dehydrogenase